jgi:hypothetical protein
LILARAVVGGAFHWHGRLLPREGEEVQRRWKLLLARAIEGMRGMYRGIRQDKPADEDRPYGVLDLEGARVGLLVDHEDWWPRRGDSWCLRLDGFVYDRIVEHPKQIRRRWLEAQDPQRFSLQPYEHLARVRRGAGQAARADQIAIDKQAAIRTRRIYGRHILQYVRGNKECTNLEAREAMASSRRAQRRALWAFGVAIWLPLLAGTVLQAWAPDWLDGVGNTGLAVAAFLLVERWFSVPLAMGLAALVFLKWGLVRNTGNYVLEILAGNGYRPMRTAGLAALVVVLGALTFDIADKEQRFIPIQARNYASLAERNALDGNITKRPAAYPHFNPWAYSLDAFLPILGGNQKTLWVVQEVDSWPADWLELYRLFHTLAGWILTTLIALSPVKLFRKD